MTNYKKLGCSETNFPIFRGLVKAIGLFSTWPFEIWDELLFREKYLQFFEDRLTTLYKILQKQYDESPYKSYGEMAKIPAFIELIRASYLQKITVDFKISMKYDDLSKKWIQRLMNCTYGKEFADLMARVDSLTNLTAYDKKDVSILEKPFDDAIEMMLKSIMK